MIGSSLNDLLKALKGLVVMSQTLENMANSLFVNSVPAMWAGKVSCHYNNSVSWYNIAQQLDNLSKQGTSCRDANRLFKYKYISKQSIGQYGQ